MKRLAVLALALTMVVSMGTAVTEYDGPEDQPHIMGGEDPGSENISDGHNHSDTGDMHALNEDGFLSALIEFIPFL